MEVICNSIGSEGCDPQCGARKRHDCGCCEPCPINKQARCLPISYTKNTFDLEYQYKQYLERVGLFEDAMSPVQRIEMKRTFMGACGVILMILKTDLGPLPEDEAVKTLQSMYDQVSDFFLKETNQKN